MINVVETKIEGLKIIQPSTFNDNRGYFMESFNQTNFENHFGIINFMQDNESYSTKGVLRGMHYQEKPYEQTKLVRAVKGEIQDVVIDLRKNSKTHLKYESYILNEDNKKQLFIPKGFAHGFLVLSDYAIVNYKVDSIYKPSHEKHIMHNDSNIGIKWMLDTSMIKLSNKDKNS